MRNLQAKLIRALAVLGLVILPFFSTNIVNAAAGSRIANNAGPCTVQVYPSWNGNWLFKHTKYIDVFGVPPNGYFIYRNYTTWQFEVVRLQSWDGRGNNWTRFGISTLWATAHWGWWKSTWYYVYPC